MASTLVEVTTPTALVISAHADDTALCAGAYIHRLVREKVEVHDLTLSDHRGVQVNYHSDIPNEHAEAMALLGVTNFRLLKYEACTGDMQKHDGEIRELFEHIRDTLKPRMVLTHHLYDSNQDHAFVATEVMRVFKQHASIMCFSFPRNEVGSRVARPEFFVQVMGSDLSAKIKAVAAYKSQVRKDHPYMKGAVVAAQAVTCGVEAGFPYAEAYHVLKLRVPNFM